MWKENEESEKKVLTNEFKFDKFKRFFA